MPQNLKKLFYSISILFFLFFTGCMPRQSNGQYTTPYNYSPDYKSVPQQKKIYKSNYPHYEIQSTSNEILIIPKSKIKRESTFEKILRQNKKKSLELTKVKHNSCREEFPSNVARGSIQ
jgi:hypothetical protein